MSWPCACRWAAGRGRIVRQLLAESGIIGLLGGLAGAALTFAGVAFAESYRPATGVAISLDLGVDGTVLLFSIAVTMLTVVAVGLLPALKASRPDLVTDLKEGGDGAGAARRSFNLKNLLVVAQVSASLVLLVGAGLFLKSLQSAMRLDAGFEPDGLATVALSLAREGFSAEEAETLLCGSERACGGSSGSRVHGSDGRTASDDFRG